MVRFHQTLTTLFIKIKCLMKSPLNVCVTMYRASVPNPGYQLTVFHELMILHFNKILKINILKLVYPIAFLYALDINNTYIKIT